MEFEFEVSCCRLFEVGDGRLEEVKVVVGGRLEFEFEASCRRSFEV